MRAFMKAVNRERKTLSYDLRKQEIVALLRSPVFAFVTWSKMLLDSAHSAYTAVGVHLAMIDQIISHDRIIEKLRGEKWAVLAAVDSGTARQQL